MKQDLSQFKQPLRFVDSVLIGDRVYAPYFDPASFCVVLTLQHTTSSFPCGPCKIRDEPDICVEYIKTKVAEPRYVVIGQLETFDHRLI